MSAPSTEVGPGFLAFVVFFFLALALWLLMRSMFTRMRRMNLAQRAQEQRETAADDRRADDGPDGSGRDRAQSDPDSGAGDGSEEGQGRSDEV